MTHTSHIDLFNAVVGKQTPTERLMFVNLLDPNWEQEYDEWASRQAQSASAANELDSVGCAVEMDYARDGE
jgi:hypothetical protein